VSVLAGSGADPAGRVAYVRTIQPGTTDVQPTTDSSYPQGTYPGPHPTVHPQGTASATAEPVQQQQQHMIVVAADINTVRTSYVSSSYVLTCMVLMCSHLALLFLLTFIMSNFTWFLFQFHCVTYSEPYCHSRMFVCLSVSTSGRCCCYCCCIASVR